MKNNLWIILVVVLVILNVFSLGLLWKDKMYHRPAKDRRPSPERYLKKRIGFSNEQLEELSELRHEHFQNVRPLEDQLRTLRRELFMTEQGPGVEVNSQLNEIGRLQLRIDSLTYIHFQQIRNICNPDQIEKFNVILEDMAQRRFGPKHERGPQGEHGRFRPGLPDSEE